MKKLHLSLAGAALTALLLAGCTQASAASGTVSAPKAMTTPAPQSEASPSESTASAPVAAPASQPTTNIAGSADPNSGYIGEDAAKAAALEHAGLTEADLQAVVIRLDYDDGRQRYDVEFYTADYAEYDYEIDADTGRIMDVDYEIEDDFLSEDTEGVEISEAEAEEIALEMVPGASSEDLHMKLERDDGRLIYEGDIRYDGMEYEFEINAENGKIISWESESEWDD